jgi:hypothetical protein
MNPSATLPMQSRSLASMSARACRVLGIDHSPARATPSELIVSESASPRVASWIRLHNDVPVRRVAHSTTFDDRKATEQ